MTSNGTTGTHVDEITTDASPAFGTPSYSSNAKHDADAETTTNKKRGNGWDDVSRQEWHKNKKPRANSDDAAPDEPRKPKRKVACLVGYCGTGYHGMQLNPPEKTIESTLFEAFVKAGAVSQDNADDAKKVALMRAARTDKGVHAAVNVISLKMIIEDPDIVAKINAQLPDEIRIWSILRTIKSFNPRSSCDSRIYEYLLPTAAFLPPPPDQQVTERINAKNSAHAIQDNGATFWEESLASQEALKKSDAYTSITEDDGEVGVLALDSSVPDVDKPRVYADMRRAKLLRQHMTDCKRAYRISSQRLSLIRSALAMYNGTKNFHNFTVGQTFAQPNSKRYIRSFVAGDPFLIDGTEWVSLKVHGQSFMLHQIRKMVAMIILITRYSAPLKVLETSFLKDKVNVPKAPSLGLLLERPLFDVYSKKAAESGREAIDLSQLNETIDAFKSKHLYDKIYAEEERDAVFYNFLSSLDAYASLGQFGYLFGEKDAQLTGHKKDVKEEIEEETALKGADIEE